MKISKQLIGKIQIALGIILIISSILIFYFAQKDMFGSGKALAEDAIKNHDNVDNECKISNCSKYEQTKTFTEWVNFSFIFSMEYKLFFLSLIGFCVILLILGLSIMLQGFANLQV